MARYSDTLRDQNGKPIVGALVSVLTKENVTATLTSDSGLPLSNPVETDQYGGYYFNAAPGIYNLRINFGRRLVTTLNNVYLGALATQAEIDAAVAIATAAAAAADSDAFQIAQDRTAVEAISDQLHDEATAGLFDSNYPIAKLFQGGKKGVWLDFTDPSVMYSDRAGTVLAATGGPVGQVKDKSGNDRHWTAATDAARPIWSLGPDGVYGLLFDGVDDYGDTLSITIPQPFTRISLLRMVTWSSVANYMFDNAGAPGPSLTMFNVQPQIGFAATALAQGNRNVGEDMVVREFFNGASSYGQQDDFPKGTANFGALSFTALRIGARWPGGAGADRYSNFIPRGVFVIEGEVSDYSYARVRAFYANRSSNLTANVVIDCAGDSLTAGVGVPGAGPLAYPGRLATRLGAGYSTVNRGIPSQRSFNIVPRTSLDVDTKINLAGNAIPASGPVAVTVVASQLDAGGTQGLSGPLGAIAPSKLAATITADDGTIVEGIYSTTTGGATSQVFNRNAPGAPLVVSPGASLKINQHGRQFYKSIYWGGRNNLGNPANANTARLNADLDAWVASRHADYLVLGLINSRDGTEGTGSVILNQILAYNAYALAKVGASRFFDVRAWLMDTSGTGPFALLGLTPTAQDIADIAAGNIPETWHPTSPADPLHLNGNGYDAVALGAVPKVNGLLW